MVYWGHVPVATELASLVVLGHLRAEDPKTRGELGELADNRQTWWNSCRSGC